MHDCVFRSSRCLTIVDICSHAWLCVQIFKVFNHSWHLFTCIIVWPDICSHALLCDQTFVHMHYCVFRHLFTCIIVCSDICSHALLCVQTFVHMDYCVFRHLFTCIIVCSDICSHGLLCVQIFKHKEKIQDISTTASNEATLENMLQKVGYLHALIKYTAADCYSVSSFMCLHLPCIVSCPSKQM